MSRGLQASPEQITAVKKLFEEGRTVGEIYQALEAGGLLSRPDRPGRVVTRRTVYRWVEAMHARDTTKDWTPAEAADADEVRLVLPTLAATLHRTQGRVWLSQATAAWVAKVVRWAGGYYAHEAPRGISPEFAYGFARAYQELEATGGDTRPIDVMLACRIWTGEGEHQWRDIQAWRAGIPGWRETTSAYDVHLEEILPSREYADAAEDARDDGPPAWIKRAGRAGALSI